MGATSASVRGGAVQTALDQIKLAAMSEDQYKGLEKAMRAAVETVINSDPAVKSAIATEVQKQIIDKFRAAQGAGARASWPFPWP
jgi:hypothetical protein